MCVELSLSASELHFRPHGEEEVGGTVQSTRYNVLCIVIIGHVCEWVQDAHIYLILLMDSQL